MVKSVLLRPDSIDLLFLGFTLIIKKSQEKIWETENIFLKIDIFFSNVAFSCNVFLFGASIFIIIPLNPLKESGKDLTNNKSIKFGINLPQGGGVCVSIK